MSTSLERAFPSKNFSSADPQAALHSPQGGIGFAGGPFDLQNGERQVNVIT